MIHGRLWDVMIADDDITLEIMMDNVVLQIICYNIEILSKIIVVF